MTPRRDGDPDLPATTVYVLDDDQAVRDSLQRLIESVDLEVRACATANEFLEVVDEHRIGCLVLDVRMRGMSGLELQQRLRREGILIPIIIITGFGDVPTAVQAMRAGAVDFIEKPVQPQVLLDRVHQALALDAAWKHKLRYLRELTARLRSLSPRERQVLDGVVMGRTTREISKDLDLRTKTVDGHRARMMKKMKVGSVAELVRKVVTSQLLQEQVDRRLEASEKATISTA